MCFISFSIKIYVEVNSTISLSGISATFKTVKDVHSTRRILLCSTYLSHQNTAQNLPTEVQQGTEMTLNRQITLFNSTKCLC